MYRLIHGTLEVYTNKFYRMLSWAPTSHELGNSELCGTYKFYRLASIHHVYPPVEALDLFLIKGLWLYLVT